MKNKSTIEDLIKLLNEATEKGNREAIEVASRAILDFSEMQSLEEAIESKISLAHKLINGGSL